MAFRPLKRMYQRIFFLISLFLFFLVSTGATENDTREKEIAVAMRMIGHELLMSLDDCTSRVLPIENINGKYRIRFDTQFEADPSIIIAVVDRVLDETKVALGGLVEVQQCNTQEVVHAFQVRTDTNVDFIPCGGRHLPKDCYQLVVHLLDPETSMSSEGQDLAVLDPSKARPFGLVPFLIPLLLVLGFGGYFMQKRQRQRENLNVVSIGALAFDKINMTISSKDKTLELSHKEAELLSFLHSSVNEPVERDRILRNVWGDDGDYVGRTLDVFISKLRKKLEGDDGVKIVNIRGVGYKLVTNASR